MRRERQGGRTRAARPAIVGVAAMIAVELASDTEAPARARAALEPLRGSLPREGFGDLRLMVSELVADDVRRQPDEDGSIRLEAELSDGRVRVELVEGWADDPDGPRERPEPGAPGWGVYLADRLADRWGIDDDGEQGDGAVLWLEKRAGAGGR